MSPFSRSKNIFIFFCFLAIGLAVQVSKKENNQVNSRKIASASEGVPKTKVASTNKDKKDDTDRQIISSLQEAFCTQKIEIASLNKKVQELIKDKQDIISATEKRKEEEEEEEEEKEQKRKNQEEGHGGYDEYMESLYSRFMLRYAANQKKKRSPFHFLKNTRRLFPSLYPSEYKTDHTLTPNFFDEQQSMSSYLRPYPYSFGQGPLINTSFSDLKFGNDYGQEDQLSPLQINIPSYSRGYIRPTDAFSFF